MPNSQLPTLNGPLPDAQLPPLKAELPMPNPSTPAA